MDNTMIIIISCLLGISIFYFIIKKMFSQLKFLKNAEKNIGSVVEVKIGYNDDDNKVFYPKVKYTDCENQTKFFEPRMDHFRNDFKIGQEIELLEDKNGDVVVNSFISIWGSLIVLIILLLALIVITIALITNFTSGSDAIAPT